MNDLEKQVMDESQDIADLLESMADGMAPGFRQYMTGALYNRIQDLMVEAVIDSNTWEQLLPPVSRRDILVDLVKAGSDMQYLKRHGIDEAALYVIAGTVLSNYQEYKFSRIKRIRRKIKKWIAYLIVKTVELALRRKFRTLKSK